MTRVPVNRRRKDGSYVYPRTLVDWNDAPDAVDVLREALASAEDASVTIIQVGFSTNLARLLDSEPDDRSSLSGRVCHEANAGGMHQYLIVDSEQRARVKEALIYLASQPPDAPPRG